MATVMDILVRPVIPYPDLRREATMVEVGPISIPVASIEHSIAMKTGTGRSKDLIDIEELPTVMASVLKLSRAMTVSLSPTLSRKRARGTRSHCASLTWMIQVQT